MLNYTGISDYNLLKEIYMINRLIELLIAFEVDDICLPTISDLYQEERCFENIYMIESYYLTIMDQKLISETIMQQIKDILNTHINKKNADEMNQYFNYYNGILHNFQSFTNLRKELLTIYTETYLKVEWERVKHEVENGKSILFDFSFEYKTLLNSRLNEIAKINEIMKSKSI